VPEQYLVYRDQHLDHPGPGRGPAARGRGAAAIQQ
jgi:hypothetical protein